MFISLKTMVVHTASAFVLAGLTLSLQPAHSQLRPDFRWGRSADFYWEPPAWSPDGSVVAYSMLNQRADVVRASDGVLVRQIPFQAAPGSYAHTVKFMPHLPGNPLDSCLVVFSATLVEFYAPPSYTQLVKSYSFSPPNDYPGDVSPDGQYYIAGQRLYKTADGSLVPIAFDKFRDPDFGNGEIPFTSLQMFAPVAGYAVANYGNGVSGFYVALVELATGQVTWNCRPRNYGIEALSPDMQFYTENHLGNTDGMVVSIPLMRTLPYTGPNGYDIADGAQYALTTPGRLLYSFAAWSPDNTKLALPNVLDSVNPSISNTLMIDRSNSHVLWSMPQFSAPTLLAFSPNSQFLASALSYLGATETVLAHSAIYNAATGAEVARTGWLLDTAANTIYSLDGSLVAGFTPRGDREMFVWQTDTGAPVATVPIGQHLASAVFSGRTIIAGFDQPADNLRAYDSNTGALLWQRTLDDAVSWISTSAAGKVLVSMKMSGIYMTVDPATGSPLQTIAPPNATGSFALTKPGVISPDGKKILYTQINGGGYNNGVYVVDLNGSAVCSVHVEVGANSPDCLAWSPDSKQFAVCSVSSVAVFNAATGARIWSDDSEWATAVSWADCGNLIMTGGVGYLKIQASTTGALKRRYTTEINPGGAVSSVHFAPNCQTVACADQMGTVRVLNNPFWTPPAVSAISCSPSMPAGGTVATGTVTLECGAPIGGVTVALSSTNSAAATVPASIPLAEGEKSVTFPVTTYPQTANATTTLKASYTYGGKTYSKTKSLTVTPPSLAGISLSASSVIGGMGVTGTVTFNGVVAADTPVTVSSLNGAVSVPPNVIVPAGSSTATFPLTTHGVTAKTAGAISATYLAVTKSVTLTVNPPVFSSLALSPNPVKRGNSVLGTVTMTGPVAANTVVTLTNLNVKASLPSPTVTILAGNASVSFVITTMMTSANVSGSVKAQVGTVTKSVTLKVTP